MKFVMEKAWDETLALLKGNIGLLATVAGLLVFLPSVAIALLFPQDAAPAPAEDATIEQVIESVTAQLGEIGWIVLVTTLLSGFASLVMMALLRRKASPTVGQAMSEAATLLPTYLGTVAIQLLVIFGLAFLLVGLPYQTGSTGLAVLGMLLLLPIWFYIFVKFSVSVAAIVIDGERNPVEAIKRSWSLTKGNSFRIFFFFVLIGIAAVIILAIMSWVVSTVLSLMPLAVSNVGMALFEGLLNLAGAIFGVALTVAIHAQLRRLRDAPAATLD